MKYQVFRNYTVENLFYGLNAVYAGYCDISFIDEEADRYIWMFFPPISLCEKSFVSEVDSYIEMLNVILNNIPSNKSIFVLTIFLFK
jgi:hypothetical protein